MSSAAASACWVARPPNLTGKAMPSPAAQTPARRARGSARRPRRSRRGRRGCPGSGGRAGGGGPAPGRRRSSGRRGAGGRWWRAGRQLGVGAGLDPDVAASSSARDRLDGARAEDRQRRVLRRDQRDLRVEAHAVGVAADEQRELVGGQRPAGARRDDDGQALGVALLEVAQQAADARRRRCGRPRCAAREGRRRAGPDGEDELVVLHVAVRRVRSCARRGRRSRAPRSSASPRRRARPSASGVRVAWPSANGRATAIGR